MGQFCVGDFVRYDMQDKRVFIDAAEVVRVEKIYVTIVHSDFISWDNDSPARRVHRKFLSHLGKTL